MNLPERIETVEQLDELLTRPSDELVQFVRSLSSPLVLLGAAGKMGPSLAVMVRRAAQQAGHNLKILAVSRFSGSGTAAWLEQRGVETISCDLLERQAVASLPDAENVIYLVGLKFGTQQNPSLTWAINTLAPAHTCEKYARARCVALSTGNVYPLVPVTSGGATEDQPLTPLGEYANAAVARERLFEYHSRKNATPVAVLRLNYAVEMRYGVLLDIAQKVWSNTAIDVTMGYLNCIWQRDANDLIVRALSLATSPSTAFNMTGPTRWSVRELALRFGELMGRKPQIAGQESNTALLSNCERLNRALGAPFTPIDHVIRRIAHWVMNQGPTLGRPTKFEVRDGQF